LSALLSGALSSDVPPVDVSGAVEAGSSFE
jgi:hypothetical protein